MIDDFGEKIHGAAKDRWQTYRTRMKTPGDALSSPLSECFPEPPYERLIQDGADPWTMAFIHSARDLIPNKPKASYNLRSWVGQVHTLRGFAQDLIEGRVSREGLEARLDRPDMARFKTQISARIDLYLALGHKKSLKGFELRQNENLRRNGVRLDPPEVRWEVCKVKAKTRLYTAVSSAVQKEDAIAEFQQKMEATKGGVSLAKPNGFKIIHYPDNPNRKIIAKKIGKNWLELAAFDGLKAAQTYLRENTSVLEERLEKLKKIPSERGENNRERDGAPVRSKDITPEAFMEAFGFRGVQFGTYVENSRRQSDLNRAYDALSDLARILDIPTQSLSLDGNLGLAFGARGRGGVGAAAAHYEPDQRVINLTKTRGAGSLAHEWFHALDHHIAERAGLGRHNYATASRATTLPEAARSLSSLSVNLRRETRIGHRSDQLDRTRSSPYYGLTIEIAARSFEAWVISRLNDEGVTNDYLANITSEEIFEAEAALMGQPAGRYPYPLEDEMGAIDAAMAGALWSPALRQVVGEGYQGLDMPETPRSEQQASQGRTEQSSKPDIWDAESWEDADQLSFEL